MTERLRSSSGGTPATAAVGASRLKVPIGLGEIQQARHAVDSVAARTPVFHSRLLSEMTGTAVSMKAENLQRTGSFKVRGVASKLASLGESAARGIVAASAGNHAQAVAFGASRAGIPCHVFMPRDAPVAKVNATESYGATVELGGDSVDDCLAMAAERADLTGEVLVHPFDDLAVIAGQGTLGLELVEQIEDLALVVVPLGGGGLASGTAIAVKSLEPSVRVAAVQAAVCAPFAAALGVAPPVPEGAASSLADGIAVKKPGAITLPIVEVLVDEVVTVEEDDIAEAMVLLLERAKLVVEGAGAVGMAALLSGALELPSRGTTALVLSGGNVDTNLLAIAIRRHETNAGRRLVVFARITDRPGHLARLLTVIGEAGGNLIEVGHLREGYSLHVRETGVQLVIETRGQEHAQRVLGAVHAAGYDVRRVQEPRQGHGAAMDS
ncbi:MAG: threonine ammonia-lyase [Actinomycetota bacterium]|nr:threonine ammonia-lyase [Actinomycetota bacterium]MDA8358062.1 threonine ammonia-lyase [Actinomycetota bacterium]